MATNTDVERVAETHFMIRPTLLRALEGVQITQESAAMLSTPSANYRELWESSLADKWFDMATLVRLGTAIETGLRDCHRRISSGASAAAGGIFQRLTRDAEILELFARDCSIDLASSTEWTTMRELMTHRHLYAHRSGLIDERYMDALIDINGTDIRGRVAAHGYPEQEVYWFEPLDRLAGFIESTRRFFRALP